MSIDAEFRCGSCGEVIDIEVEPNRFVADHNCPHCGEKTRLIGTITAHMGGVHVRDRMSGQGTLSPKGPPGWRDQWERALRLYRRFERLHEGAAMTQSNRDFEDDVYAFFVFAHHLRDWLQHDDTISVSGDEIMALVGTSEALRLCADVCNGVKHLRREPRRHAIDPEARLGRTEFRLESGSPTQYRARFEIPAAGKTYDAFSVAADAVAAWRGFLSDHGLLDGDATEGG